VQVSRLADLKLLRTLALPPGPRGPEQQAPASPSSSPTGAARISRGCVSARSRVFSSCCCGSERHDNRLGCGCRSKEERAQLDGNPQRVHVRQRIEAVRMSSDHIEEIGLDQEISAAVSWSPNLQSSPVYDRRTGLHAGCLCIKAVAIVAPSNDRSPIAETPEILAEACLA
jgi:hypothetical protein